MEDIVHEALKGLGGVAEAKRHGEVLVEAKGSDDRCLGDVGRMNWDLVVAFYEIQLGEDGGSVEAGGKVLEVGKRVAVRGGGEVKAAVIATGSPRAVRLWYQVERRRPGTVGTADNARRFQLVKFVFCLLETCGVQPAGLGKNRRPSRLDVVDDTMAGRVGMEISGENRGVSMEKGLEWRWKVVEGGQRRGGDGNGRRWRGGGRRGTEESMGWSVDNLMVGGIDEEVVGGQEISSKDRIGNMSKDKRESELKRWERHFNFADSPSGDWRTIGGDELWSRRR